MERGGNSKANVSARRSGQHGAGQGGQALVMVTLSLFVLVGMLGLAVDLGWAYFVRRAEQSAADAGALAAVSAALEAVGGVSPPYVSCPTGATCTGGAQVSCPASGNLTNGCLYVAAHGFTPGGESGRQTVTIAADITSPPPTVPNVSAGYWVTVRVVQYVPQLFSAIQGHMMATVAARATAAIVNVDALGSLILLNRHNDGSPVVGTGVDLSASPGSGGGSSVVNVPGGIVMASTANGDPSYAGMLSGKTTVNSPFTYVQGSGNVNVSGSSSWDNVQHGFADGAAFQDIMQGKGQPPLPTISPTGSCDHPVLNGAINTVTCAGGICAPGYYYSVRIPKGCTKNCIAVPDGEPLQVTENVTFSSSTGVCSSAAFGQYVFYGGLIMSKSGLVVTLRQGEYIMAGALSGNAVLNVGNSVTVTDGGPLDAQSSAAGEIFVFTDGTYKGLTAPVALQSQGTVLQDLQFGSMNCGQGNDCSVQIKAGNNDQSLINLHGLNTASGDLPSSMDKFGTVLFWQDQRNTRVKYTSDGHIDYTSCGSGHDINNPCTNALIDPHSPEINLSATPKFHPFGTIYQPRGAWTSLQGSGNYTGAMTIITGAVKLGGSGTMTLTGNAPPLPITVSALIE
jgi:hypothetical protein